MANTCLLDKVDWQIQPKDRIALVGRNGAGKSSLLKLLQGFLVCDSGQVEKRSGLRVAGLSQDVEQSDDETVYHFLVSSLGDIGQVLLQWKVASVEGCLDTMMRCQQQLDDAHAWDQLPLIETMASRLGLTPDLPMNKLSGGMKRRVLLAAALIAKPSLLLLDEPTNHLDLGAIEWLESYIKSYSGSLVVVTHDRAFLKACATQIVEIDRGQLYVYQTDYETFLEKREARRLAQNKLNMLFDKQLREEEVWLRQGVKARRTRNEGRVRALEAMREQHQQRRAQQGQVKSLSLKGERSGQIVIEAQQVSYQIDDKPLIRDFSLLLMRGDKVGIIGPNGCGKTTLIRLLMGELKPDLGSIRQGTSLEVGYFDQLRTHLDESQTVFSYVGDGGDYVTQNGKQKHVASYLRDFLFLPERFHQPIFSLSGGERNRLLLARLLTRPVNVLVMDEPTNDLDIETQELLESLLVDYQGTLLLISHDRAFINEVVTSVLVYEGEGRFVEYVGGYDDYRRHQKQLEKTVSPVSIKPSSKKSDKLSFQELRELEGLPQQIESLEQKVKESQLEMTQPAFYQQDASKIADFNRKLADDETLLTTLFMRWDRLEAKNGGR